VAVPAVQALVLRAVEGVDALLGVRARRGGAAVTFLVGVAVGVFVGVAGLWAYGVWQDLRDWKA
jgi:hypothetical protein